MNYYIVLAIFLFAYMNLWFILSLLKKRNDIADVAWGLGFVLMAWVSFFLSPETNWRSILVSSLVTIWGIRLAWHIYTRNKNKKEDLRYKKWRRSWGKLFYIRSYLQVFILQGLFLFLIVFPVLFTNQKTNQAFTILDLLGVVVWLTGFFFEVIGDLQLSRFIKDPKNKGRIMDRGLWRYSRHPNYFGEVTLWWGVFLIATSVPGGWLTFFGPITITVLIVFVSGIPLLEKQFADRQDFREYKKKTSIFFPLPPKRVKIK